MRILRILLLLACAALFFSQNSDAQADSKGQMKSTRPANAPADYGTQKSSAKPANTSSSSSSNGEFTMNDLEDILTGPLPAGSKWREGALIGHAGLGLISPYYYRGASMVVPPLFVAAEYGITDRIGVGGILGYTTSRWVYRAGPYRTTYHFSNVLIGARGAYHLYQDRQWDTYGGAMLGLSVGSARATTLQDGASLPETQYNAPEVKASRLALGLFIGARYYFKPQWAAFAELGYNVGILSGGIAYKFQ